MYVPVHFTLILYRTECSLPYCIASSLDKTPEKTKEPHVAKCTSRETSNNASLVRRPVFFIRLVSAQPPVQQWVSFCSTSGIALHVFTWVCNDVVYSTLVVPRQQPRWIKDLTQYEGAECTSARDGSQLTCCITYFNIFLSLVRARTHTRTHTYTHILDSMCTRYYISVLIRRKKIFNSREKIKAVGSRTPRMPSVACIFCRVVCYDMCSFNSSCIKDAEQTKIKRQ